jgi:hypothetical protein
MKNNRLRIHQVQLLLGDALNALHGADLAGLLIQLLVFLLQAGGLISQMFQFLLALTYGKVDGQERCGGQNDGHQHYALEQGGTAPIYQPDAAEGIFSIGHGGCLRFSAENAYNDSNILYPIFSRLQRENLQKVSLFSKIFCQGAKMLRKSGQLFSKSRKKPGAVSIPGSILPQSRPKS